MVDPIRFELQTNPPPNEDGTYTAANSVGTYASKDEMAAALELLMQGTSEVHGYDTVEGAMDVLRLTGSQAMDVLGEVLLFLNASNSRITKYQVKKKEMPKAPKPFLPKYEYRILDLYRTKTEYQSLEEVEEFLTPSDKVKLQRRAHLVRGHFKTRNGKLFWWNAFLRNRKNIDSMGVVDKDYQLVK